jgi:hypothetical protein
LVSGRTVALHLRAPQREQRSRLITSASLASQPARAARVWGCAILVWPHSHFSIKTYWPKWSESFTTAKGARGGIIPRILTIGGSEVHTVEEPSKYCIKLNAGKDRESFMRMIRIVVASAALAACVTVPSTVVSIGKDTYQLSMTGVGFATQANTNVKALQAANAYCEKLGKHLLF